MIEAGGFEDLLAIPPSLLIAIVEDKPETILENSCHAVPSTGAIEGVHLQIKWYCGYLRTHVSYSTHRANQSSAYFSHATACPEEWWQLDPPRNDTWKTGLWTSGKHGRNTQLPWGFCTSHQQNNVETICCIPLHSPFCPHPWHFPHIPVSSLNSSFSDKSLCQRHRSDEELEEHESEDSLGFCPHRPVVKVMAITLRMVSQKVTLVSRLGNYQLNNMVQTNEACVSKILGPKKHIETDQFSWGWIVYLSGYSVPNMHAQPYPYVPWLKAG